MNYIDAVYNLITRPITEYPDKLVCHLQEKFKIKTDSKILVLGCGRGDEVRAFTNIDMNVSCLDKVKSEQHKGLKIKYLDISKQKFPYTDNTFDVVFSKSLIEHIPDPGNMVKETYRVLKQGGRCIVMTPDWVSQMTTFYDDHTHVQPYTMRGMTDLLKMYDFDSVSSELFYQLPVIWRYPYLKVVSWILRRFFKPNCDIKNKFIRWSLQLMILSSGVKNV